MNASISQKRIQEIRDAFALFDKDGDGTISSKELKSVMRTCGMNPTDKEIQRLMAAADSDGSGVIEFNEFLDMMEDYNQVTEDDILNSFKMFDRNEDGQISKSELKFVIKDLGLRVRDDQVNEMITMADADGDGQISYAEFMRLMISKAGRR